jgi:hypothetical protein
MEIGTLWVLVLSVPPCWLMVMYYRAYANNRRLRGAGPD